MGKKCEVLLGTNKKLFGKSSPAFPGAGGDKQVAPKGNYTKRQGTKKSLT